MINRFIDLIKLLFREEVDMNIRNLEYLTDLAENKHSQRAALYLSCLGQPTLSDNFIN